MFYKFIFDTKVLVNMFNSALSSTLSDSTGLTALVIWILSCIIFVFTALFFYVVILVNNKRFSKKTNPKNLPLDKERSDISSENRVDLDPLFFVIHFLAFGLFIITYCFLYLF